MSKATITEGQMLTGVKFNAPHGGHYQGWRCRGRARRVGRPELRTIPRPPTTSASEDDPANARDRAILLRCTQERSIGELYTILPMDDKDRGDAPVFMPTRRTRHSQ